MIQSEEVLWYFAYGSNMSAQTFRDHRGINPLNERAVRIPGWELRFDVYGIPYQEPAFASIAPTTNTATNTNTTTTASAGAPLSRSLSEVEVHGIAYLVTREQYTHIIASEGGDIVYQQMELLAVPVDPLGEADERFKVWTLVTSFGHEPPRLPSLRYKKIMVQGGQEAGLPEHYRQYLQRMRYYPSPATAFRRLGAALFLSVWIPIMTFAESLTKLTVDWDGHGNVPAFTKFIVRCILLAMWYHHDHVHARIWGRGDGLDESTLLWNPSFDARFEDRERTMMQEKTITLVDV